MVIAIRDELIGMLSSQPLVRSVEPGFLRRAQAYFGDFFGSLLGSTVRRHPLGFVYVSEKIADGVFLRFHFWPFDWSMPSLEAGREDHDHTYELTSLIVAGALRHQTFRVNEVNTGPFQILKVTYANGDSTLWPTGQRVEVQSLENQVLREGDSYRLPPGRVHRATPIQRPTATVALTREGDRRREARVIGAVVGADRTTFHRQELSLEEIARYRAALNEVFQE